MMLRVSSKLEGSEVDLHAVTEGIEADSGVVAEKALITFVDATLNQSEDLPEIRAQLLAEVGNEGLVDAAAVVGNFQRMVRIADGTGIPLDDIMAAMTADLRDELGLNALASAQRTKPVSALKKWLVKILQPFILRQLRKRMQSSKA